MKPFMAFTRFRAHAQICVKIDDEHRLEEEALQVNLEGARQAKSSVARVVHEICYCTSIQRRSGRHAAGGASCPFQEILVSDFAPSARLQLEDAKMRASEGQ